MRFGFASAQQLKYLGHLHFKRGDRKSRARISQLQFVPCAFVLNGHMLRVFSLQASLRGYHCFKLISIYRLLQNSNL